MAKENSCCKGKEHHCQKNNGDNNHHDKDCCDHKHDHDHDRCCEHGEEELFDTLTLTLDDGTELHCLVLGDFEVDNKDYIALLPTDEGYTEDILIYGLKAIDETEVELIFIEDEAEFDKVAAEFEKIFEEFDEE